MVDLGAVLRAGNCGYCEHAWLETVIIAGILGAKFTKLCWYSLMLPFFFSVVARVSIS